jgi:hypothetical protein
MAAPLQGFPKTQLQMNTACDGTREVRNTKSNSVFTAGFKNPLTALQDKLYGFA